VAVLQGFVFIPGLRAVQEENLLHFDRWWCPTCCFQTIPVLRSGNFWT